MPVGSPRSLFDHLVGAGEHGGRNRYAQRLRGSSIDDQLKLSRLLDRQIARLVSFRAKEHDPTGIAVQPEGVA